MKTKPNQTPVTTNSRGSRCDVVFNTNRNITSQAKKQESMAYMQEKKETDQEERGREGGEEREKGKGEEETG